MQYRMWTALIDIWGNNQGSDLIYQCALAAGVVTIMEGILGPLDVLKKPVVRIVIRKAIAYICAE